MSIHELITQSVSDELERRLDEHEDLIEFTQADRASLESELREAIADAVGSRVSAADPDDLAAVVAEQVAGQAFETIRDALADVSRSRVRRAIAGAVERVVRGRLDEAKRYFTLLHAARAAYEQTLPYRVVKLISERLDSCQDWLHLQCEDWDRMAGVLVPELDEGPFRKYAAETLALWGKVGRTVLPEAYEDPARVPVQTDQLAGTWEKVDVMAERFAAGRQLYSPADAVLADSDGVIAQQAAGNGKKDARTIEGEAVEKFVIRMQGVEPGEPTPAEEWNDPDWWRMRPPTGGVGPSGEGGCVSDGVCAGNARDIGTVVRVDVLPDHPDDTPARPAAAAGRTPFVPAVKADEGKGKKRKKRQAADEGWLKFDGFLGAAS